VAAGNEVFELQNQGMATSSNLGGNYVEGNHIINAKSANPAANQTVTIIADSALKADSQATIAVLQQAN
jgi:thiamine biosynthesis lipoprotein ApbE